MCTLKKSLTSRHFKSDWSPLSGQAAQDACGLASKHLQQAVVARSKALPVAVLPLTQARQLLLGALQLPRAPLGRRAQLPQLRLQVACIPRVRLLCARQLMLHLLQFSLQAPTAYTVLSLSGELHT